KDEVRLLHDLFSVEVEVVEVKEERVLVRLCIPEVPMLVLGEIAGLLVHSQRLVVWDVHMFGSSAPSSDLSAPDLEPVRFAGVAVDGRGGPSKVSLRHQVGVQVVVGKGAVLVRAGHSVDPESAV